MCGRYARTVGKAAFNLATSVLLDPYQPRALQELDQRQSAKNSRISAVPSEESDENQGRVSAPLHSFAENRSATPGGGGGGSSVSFSLILSLSFSLPPSLPPLPLSLSHSYFSFSSSHVKDSPVTGMPSRGSSLIDFLTYFRLIIIRPRNRGDAERGGCCG